MLRKKGITMLLILTILFATLPVRAWAQPVTVRVAVQDFPNFLYMEEDGSVSGYAADYIEDIAEENGWKITYVRMSLLEATYALARHEVDIMAGCQYVEGREEYGTYSAQPLCTGRTVLVALKGQTKYAYQDYEAFNGMRIGVLNGSVRQDALKSEMRQQHYSAQLFQFSTAEEAMRALRLAQVDAVLMNDIRCTEEMCILDKIEVTPLYFKVSTARPELVGEIDRAMEEISGKEPYYQTDLYRKYYGSILRSDALTRSEKQYVKQNPALRVACPSDWAPYVQAEKDGDEFTGLLPALYARLSEKTGLQFDLVAYETFAAAEQAVKTGQADLLAATGRQSAALNNTETFLSSPMVLLTNLRAGGRVLSLCTDRATTEVIQTLNPILWKEVVEEDSIRDCLEAVRKGEAHGTIVSSDEADAYLSQPRYDKLQVSRLVDWEQELSIGISPKADARLLSILNKGLSGISQEEMNVLLLKSGGLEHSFLLSDLLYTNPIGVVSLFTAGFILLGTILFFVYCMQTGARERVMQQRVNSAKTEFLAHISHAIRTPLNAIIGMNRMMSENMGSPDTVRSCTEEITTASTRLLYIVNEILDVSGVGEERQELAKEKFDLKQMLHVLEEVYVQAAKESNVTLHFEVEDAIHPFVVGDERRLKSVLVTLLTNAIKYNREGGSAVFKLKCTGADGEKQALYFEVNDTGIGMEESFCKRIFHDFERETRMPRHIIGINLSCAYQAVRMMGGVLQADSSVGEGSCFSFAITLPIAKDVPAILPRGTQAPQFANRTILVVEDNEVNMLIINRILSRTGARLLKAKNGREAVEAFCASGDFELMAILMDVRMPVMDGHEATRCIRAMERVDAQVVPIVALSANAFAQDIQESLRNGMDAHLTKPVEPETLYCELEKCLDKLQRLSKEQTNSHI